MDIAILGPLQARVDGRVIPLGGPKQRALLAMLALHANEPVSRDRLIEALWGEEPPASVHQSLDSYVSRLRRALGSDRVLREPGGYVLRLDRDELDLDRFDRLVQEARAAASPADAAALLREALALWRGPALADVLYEPGINGQAERLEEQRLAATEELFDAELTGGDGAALVTELQRLVSEHPLRERLLGQLMLALYRAGRQADALAAMQAGRHRLADELGLEPGPQLQELERRILRHDPTLDRDPRLDGGDRPRTPWRTAAVLATAAAAAALLLASGSSERPPVTPGDDGGLVAFEDSTGKLVGWTELPGQPSAIAFGAGSVWAADSSGATVERVDPASGDVVDRIPIGGEPGSVVFGGGAVWVATTVGGSIKRIDPATAAVTQSVSLEGASAAAIAAGPDALWAADATNRALVEIDPEAGSKRRKVPLDLRPSAVAVGRGVVWVAGHDEGTVEAIDPDSGDAVTTVRVGQGPTAVAVADDAVWVANGLDSTVSRIDARSGSVVATIPVGSGPSALTVSGGSVWVANTYSGTVSRIDPRRNRVVATLRVGGRPVAVAAHADDVWVGTAPRGDSHRGGTLRLVTTAPFPSIDPGFHQMTTLLPRLAYDTLVTFQAASGPAGLRLVPDLALALPTPSRGGTTYVFRLRPGIRYSDGRVLRTGDFRRAIERLFRADSPGASRFDGVVGSEACTQRPAPRCDLSRGIVTNESARTVTFHLRVPDPDFLYKLTVVGFSAPVPPGTPDGDTGSRPVPGTGPYRIESSNRRELRLVRNPFFREWSHAAQPDGNAGAIVWRFASSQARAVREVEHGRADWVYALLPPAQLRGLRLRNPDQLRQNPSFAVDFIPLNTRRPPFDDIRVRRALNYAIDRARIARMYGGAVATPICQPLPRGFPGYRRYCPYTVDARRDGRWKAPDLAEARRLVAASGTRGMRIDVWGVTDLAYLPRGLPRYVAEVLRSLGYRTRLHLVPYNSLDTPAKRRGFQLTVDGDWVPDYPAPSSFLPPFFGCDGGNNRRQYVCDRELDRRMRRASALELEDSARAAALWAEVDRELVDRAYWVPTVNVGLADLISARLRDYQYHPVWGFMAAQASVR